MPSSPESACRIDEKVRIFTGNFSSASSVFVADKAKYVDLIVALQPSMLSWNPSVTGNVGRMIGTYNPCPEAKIGSYECQRWPALLAFSEPRSRGWRHGRFHNNSFDPQTLVVLETAFDEAWLTLIDWQHDSETE
jgi:hypothetical protein